jgi:hypothetical protein
MRTGSLPLAVTTLLLAQVGPVRADITYTFSGVGTGSLGSANFTDAAFTITIRYDPTQVYTSPFDQSVNNSAAMIAITGLNPANILNTATHLDPTSGTLDMTGTDYFLGATANEFTSFDLTNPSIGPISGSPSTGLPGGYFDTDAGKLSVTAIDGSITFQVAAIPEPGSCLLTGLAMTIGATWYGMRRLRLAASASVA